MDVTIQHLYSTFGQYSTAGMHYCPCGCINEQDVVRLNSKNLNDLQVDDLASYHGSALYTWGDVQHYKYYLPRILELYATQRFSLIGLDDVYTKLAYARWEEWPYDEQRAIKDFVLADWMQRIDKHDAEIDCMKIGIYSKFISLGDLISLWDKSSSENALRNFVSFFYDHGNQLMNDKLKIDNEKYPIDWQRLRDLTAVLERTFFENESSDNKYAERVSVVLQMIEQGLRLKKID